MRGRKRRGECATINRVDGIRLQVDYGNDETALVYLWQVHVADS